MSFFLPVTCLLVLCFQRRCRQNWSLHHPQHRLGENALRRSGWYLPDCEDAPDAETSYGPDWGQASHTVNTPSQYSATPLFQWLKKKRAKFFLKHYVFIFLSAGRVSVLLPRGPGVLRKLWSLCNVKSHLCPQSPVAPLPDPPNSLLSHRNSESRH